MRILLIDADSTIPNIALMKLAYWHKSQGDVVELIRLNIPYYPNKRVQTHHISTLGYDKTYCSVVFDRTCQYVRGEGIVFGGTGYSLTINLPDEIENGKCDYSIYPENETSYGFISRGCIRKCFFCKVPEKEGVLRQVSTIGGIVQHKKVKFLDNNFLALPNCKELLRELVDTQLNCQFNQGLDIRLVDEGISELLSQMNYLGDYIFAFDDIRYRDLIERKLELLSWRKPFRIKFFVYVHPDMPVWNVVHRVQWLQDKKCLPYVMRDVSCWGSPNSDFYTDLSCWANQPGLFRNMEFEYYLKKRCSRNKNGLQGESLKRFENGVQLYRDALSQDFSGFKGGTDDSV